MDSDLVHQGAVQRFRVPVLKAALKKKKLGLEKLIEEMTQEVRRVAIRVSNARDDTKGMQQDSKS